jgi:hypothetical protein
VRGCRVRVVTARTEPPEGYTAPFYKATREAEMRAAHAYFIQRMKYA